MDIIHRAAPTLPPPPLRCVEFERTRSHEANGPTARCDGDVVPNPADPTPPITEDAFGRDAPEPLPRCA